MASSAKYGSGSRKRFHRSGRAYQETGRAGRELSVCSRCAWGSIGPDGPRLNDGVHVGTLQRFKGLEYQRMIVDGITDAAVPGQRATTDQARQQREVMRARSLLFVAATRARDALVISWNGQPAVSYPQCRRTSSTFRPLSRPSGPARWAPLGRHGPTARTGMSRSR